MKIYSPKQYDDFKHPENSVIRQMSENIAKDIDKEIIQNLIKLANEQLPITKLRDLCM